MRRADSYVLCFLNGNTRPSESIFIVAVAYMHSMARLEFDGCVLKFITFLFGALRILDAQLRRAFLIVAA